jgi:YHS domain-containing protein
MKKTVSMFFAAALALAAFAPAMAQEKKGDSLAWQKNNYPTEMCVVSDEKLGSMGAPFEHVHEGRLVLLCCKGCVSGFQKDPAKYLQALDAAVIKKQTPDYPLDTCVVGGGKLGSMGEPANYVHEGRLVRFCCAGCTKGFQKDPAKYVAKIEEAEKAKKAKK